MNKKASYQICWKGHGGFKIKVFTEVESQMVRSVRSEITNLLVWFQNPPWQWKGKKPQKEFRKGILVSEKKN